MLLYGLHDGLDLRPGQKNQLGRSQEGQVHGHGHAVDVEEGDGPQHHLLSLLEIGDPGADLEGVAGEIPVGEHGPLGHTRGPSRVLQKGEVVQV